MKYNALREVLKEEKELAGCSHCRQPLIVIELNSVVDIVVCDNPLCKAYRTPVRNIPASLTGKRKKKLDKAYTF